MNIFEKIKNGWNAFNGRDPTAKILTNQFVSASRPDRSQMFFRYSDKTFITSIKTRIAMDVAAITINHVKLDEQGRYSDTINSELNSIFTLEANKDQTGRSFVQDIVYSMLDEGNIAVCPTFTKCEFSKPNFSPDDVIAMRVGKIVQWYPDHVLVRIFDDETNSYKELCYRKSQVAIIQNPLYEVMNEPNSILKRLLRKLSLLDVIDEQSGAGKLDLIIQLPYVIKGQARRDQAEARRKDIEMQLSGSKYGIAYTDGTERITQLNRPVENNLMSQIEYLTNTLYGQLGVTQSIFDGTADEQTLLNYNNRTVEPIVSAIVDEFKRKFLSTTARTQGQSIQFYRDPFKLAPVGKIAEIADKFTRNEIMSSNEIRQTIGMRLSKDPKADMLINSNLNHEGESEMDYSIGDLNKEEIQNE